MAPAHLTIISLTTTQYNSLFRYLSGCLSYPRTESTAYPSSFDFSETLTLLRSHPDLGSYAEELLRDGHNRPRRGQDAGDHPPITPVAPIYNSPVFNGDCHRIYDMVVRHFLASISPDARFEVTNLAFIAPGCGEEFTAKGKQETDPGYLRCVVCFYFFMCMRVTAICSSVPFKKKG